MPFLAEIIRDTSPTIVIQKSAQVGATELLVTKAIWAADTAYAGRGNVLFMMPTQNQMDDFAQARIDLAIQNSPYLRERLQPQPPRRKGADSKRLKRLGEGHIFLRGADSRRQIASVDADLVILDEFDQMADGTIALAEKRLASSSQGQLIVASTPRLPEAGVNALFLQSDQCYYHLTCGQCGLEQALTWEANVDTQRVAVVCARCRAPLDRLQNGRWIPAAPGNRIRGYHISRLYSPWLQLEPMIVASQSLDLHELQEFYNSDLGEVYSPPGGGLSLEDLDRCRRNYGLESYSGQRCVMGVDVGAVLHVVIRQAPDRELPRAFSVPRREVPPGHIDTDTGLPPPGLYPEWQQRPSVKTLAASTSARLWFVGTVSTFEELEGLIQGFHVERAIIDSQPEMHKARELARRMQGVVALADYHGHGLNYERTSDGGVTTWRTDRTAAIDETFARFRNQFAELPANARSLGGNIREGLGEYTRQVLVPKRVLTQDAREDWVSRYTSARADHYAHAEVYAMLAAYTTLAATIWVTA